MELLSNGPSTSNQRNSSETGHGSHGKKSLTSLEFEVTGRVQGVHFRRYLKLHAIKLEVRGYGMHSPNGSVVGEIQGTDESLKHMKIWLKDIGSLDSRIDEAIFTNERSIDDYTFADFKIS